MLGLHACTLHEFWSVFVVLNPKLRGLRFRVCDTKLACLRFRVEGVKPYPPYPMPQALSRKPLLIPSARVATRIPPRRESLKYSFFGP